MVKFIKDSNNKILQYIETTHEVATADDIPAEPETKIGKTNVAYYNPEKKVIEWRQEDRPLTPEEQLLKLEENQKANSQAIQDLALAGMGGV